MRVTLEWLKEFIDIRTKPDELARLLTMGGLEVESREKLGNDIIFDLGVTPNRADCLSVIGVAREIAALTGKKLAIPNAAPLKGKGRIKDFLNVTVRSPAGCPRYSARVINGVRVAPSPSWMVRRLAACGVRPINNIVDATNYVMLETGQPLHAFDYKFIRGKKIVVSGAKESFDFITLDETKQRITPGDILICDGEGAVALAGVMGGKNSEVSDATTAVVLESAYFDPVTIRRTSKRLDLISESSRRFERGVDPGNVVNTLNRLTAVICEIAGGSPTVDSIDVMSRRIVPCKIRLDESEILRILGEPIKLRDAQTILSKLGITAAPKSRISVVFKVPTYRPDLTRPVDLIEEIARLYGYSKFVSTMPDAKVVPLVQPRFALKIQRARELLIGCGFSEAVLMGFANPAELEPFAGEAGSHIGVENPIAADQNVMRTMLLPGLLSTVSLNKNRQRKDVRLFALQRVYEKKAEADFEERLHLAGVVSGSCPLRVWDQKSRDVNFYDAKGAVEALFESFNLGENTVWQRGDEHRFLHPGKSADILVSNKRVGFVGLLHPEAARKWDISDDVYVFELDFEVLANLSFAQIPKFTELSKYPFVDRDLAIIVDERIPSVEILKVIESSGVPFVSDVRIFDVFRGGGIKTGKKSMAYSIRYASSERTLTDEEVNEAHEKIIRALEEKLGAVLRT